MYIFVVYLLVVQDYFILYHLMTFPLYILWPGTMMILHIMIGRSEIML